mmetsp:Transcript_45410/g.51550  ORF Transcript_45410/g.51550 Transcript_45410/m.51550 type:complete len:82 (+) Transcript_45410:123-368(+)
MPQRGYDRFIVLNVSHIHLEGQKKERIDLNDNPCNNEGTIDSSYCKYHTYTQNDRGRNLNDNPCHNEGTINSSYWMYHTCT